MNIKRTTVGALALFAVFAADAKSWYFTGTESETGSPDAFVTPSRWVDENGQPATAFSADDTYCLGDANASQSASMRAGTGTFADGASLKLEAAKNYTATLYLNGGTTTFGNGMELGKNGRLIVRSTTATPAVIAGDVVLTSSDGSQVAYIIGGTTSHPELTFSGTVTSGDSKAFMILPNDDTNYRNMTVRFLGDVQLGRWSEIYVRDPASSTLYDYNVRLAFGNITFNAPLRIDGNKAGNAFSYANRMRLAVNTVDDTVTLVSGLDMEKYPFHSDTYLEFPVDATTGKAGKMVSQAPFYGATNPSIGVILTGNVYDGPGTNRFELLTVPASTPLLADRFRLVKTDGPTESVKFDVVTDAETSTLYAVVPPTAEYVQSDSGSQWESKGTHIESADGWSNGRVPEPGVDYWVRQNGSETRLMRTPDSNTSASYAFPGHSLTIATNAILYSFVSSLQITDLRLLGGSSFYSSQPNPMTFTGKIDVSGTARIGTYSSRQMRFNGEFTGSGTLDFAGMFIADNAYAQYSLLQESPEFFGKMIVRTDYRDAKSVPTWDADFGELQISASKALGADLPTLTTDALTLTDYAYLQIGSDLTIAKSSNRGIAIKDYGRVWLGSGRKARIETPITVDGTFRKEGVGILTQAGPIVSVHSNGADRVVLVHGKMILGGSVSGVTLQMEKDTELALDPDPADATFTAKGLDFSLVSNPITLDASFGGKLPLDSWAADEQIDLPTNPFTYAVVTVKAADADAMRAMLPTNPPKRYKDCRAKWVETVDAAAGTVTFAVENGKYGMTLILR